MPTQEGEMTEASEIRTEQAKLDELYARLDQLREETTARLGTVRISEVGGNHQHRTERDAFATLYEDQLIRLDGAEEGLCFGRLDLVDEDEPTYMAGSASPTPTASRCSSIGGHRPRNASISRRRPTPKGSPAVAISSPE